MKVVFLADAPYIHEQRWVRHFVARGDDVEVISFRPAQIDGARVHYIGGAETLGKARYLVHARRVKRLVHSLKPDLVHALHLTSYGFLGALSGFHPLVISVFGTDILEAPRLTPFHHWLTRHALSHADAITATGLHLATETTRYAPRSTPVTVVPYGVEMDRFVPSQAHPARDQVVFGTVARLSPEKGIRYLIEAFALLRARYGDKVRLVIAGDTSPAPGGPDRRDLDELAKQLRIADAVEFRGWVEHDALPAFLSELEIFVMPSIFEGFGVAAVEASAMELPVVASNVYGIPDVVRDGLTGLLVPPKDPQAIADACAYLVDDPALRARLGVAGRAYVGERYDWRQNAAQMERVYERVTGSKQQVTGSTGQPNETPIAS